MLSVYLRRRAGSRDRTTEKTFSIALIGGVGTRTIRRRAPMPRAAILCSHEYSSTRCREMVGGMVAPRRRIAGHQSRRAGRDVEGRVDSRGKRAVETSKLQHEPLFRRSGASCLECRLGVGRKQPGSAHQSCTAQCTSSSEGDGLDASQVREAGRWPGRRRRNSVRNFARRPPLDASTTSGVATRTLVSSDGITAELQGRRAPTEVRAAPRLCRSPGRSSTRSERKACHRRSRRA